MMRSLTKPKIEINKKSNKKKAKVPGASDKSDKSLDDLIPTFDDDVFTFDDDLFTLDDQFNFDDAFSLDDDYFTFDDDFWSFDDDEFSFDDDMWKFDDDAAYTSIDGYVSYAFTYGECRFVYYHID